MIPVGPLMIEHRLIERMINLMNEELQRIKRENQVDQDFLNTAIDFIRTYADRCHHGKEEDILFRDLGKKSISAEHKKIMDELIKEHVMGRNNVKKIMAAKESYMQGNQGALKDIISNMEILIKFYPKHIEKEDKHFFIPCMKYFTDAEREAMLNEMWVFDRNMIHKKYSKVVEEQEQKSNTF